MRKRTGGKPFFLGNVFRKVERAKQQWESTVDALPELICMVDGEQKIVRANRTLERWQLGDVKGVAGRDFHSVVHPDCDDPGCYLFNLLVTAGPPAAGEPALEMEAYDPHLERHIRVEMCPIPGHDWQEGTTGGGGRSDTNGGGRAGERPYSRAIILHDISEHKRLVRSLERHAHRLRTINGISRSVLGAEAPQEHVVAAISHLKSFLPVQKAVVFLLNGERSHFSVLADEPPSPDMAAGDTLSLSQMESVAHRALDREYTVRQLAELPARGALEEAWRRQGIHAYANMPLRIDGRWLGSLVVGKQRAGSFSGEDMEVIGEAAELLTVALDQSRLYGQLQETNAELERLLRAKQERMQDLSHEVRSPLALIQGFVELMQKETLGPLTPEQREALTVMGDKGERLLAFMERMLLLQTMGAREMVLEQTDLETFLREIVAPWRLPANNRGIELKIEIPSPMPLVQIDQSLFPQVISNLLDNALKYTPSGGVITVGAWPKGDEVVIEVTDSGPGLPRDLLESIFNRYTQGSDGTEVRGAGIGLALCREVVQAHGGTISAASAGREQGSTFTVRLPSQLRQVSVEEPGLLMKEPLDE